MRSLIKTGVPLSAQSREIIHNVHCYFVNEALTFKRSHGGHFNPVQKRAVAAIGISKTTLNRLLSEKFLSPDCETPRNIRPKIGKSSKGKSHAQLCEIVYNVYLYIKMECEKYNTVENGYFNDVEDRVVKATGICRSFLSKLLNEKGNRVSLHSKSKKTKSTDSPKHFFDSRTLEMIPIVISSSESDNDSEMSAMETFSVTEYVLE